MRPMEFINLCPRFESCSATLCLDDPDWDRRVVRGADRICFWLTEAVKVGAAERFKQSGHEDYFTKATNLLPAILASSTIMRSRLRSAEQTGPRLGRQVGANDTEAA